MNQVMFHTQEYRGDILTHPVFCEKKDACFGTAYYLWAKETDAIRWGYNFVEERKKRLRFLDIETIPINTGLSRNFYSSQTQ